MESVDDVLLIFTYAPAGLGHLRVMDALMDGRTGNCPYEVMGTDDRFIRWIHRLTSVNPLAQKIFEAFQSGPLEDVFTKMYVNQLRFKGKLGHDGFVRLINKHPGVKKVVIVATHFGLAHEFAKAKSVVEKETGKKVFLVVQVTDATWQHIWYVRGADMTVVPSERVKKELGEFGWKNWKEKQKMVVIPYPLSGILTKRFKNVGRRKKVLVDDSKKINVSIPISGAGTGLTYLAAFLPALHKLSNRFVFWIVAKRTMYNMMFLSSFGKKSWVKLVTADDDHKLVNLYEELFSKRLITLEVTKPSEQAFKAILNSGDRGGCIMLFLDPIGRQEYDNIDFLSGHKLIPGRRGMMLPKNPGLAAEMVKQCLDDEVFVRMEKMGRDVESADRNELGGEGVKRFWTEVEKLIG